MIALINGAGRRNGAAICAAFEPGEVGELEGRAWPISAILDPEEPAEMFEILPVTDHGLFRRGGLLARAIRKR